MLLPTLFTFVVLCVTTTLGAPQIALPFNAQVPSVARVSQPYSYKFSPSTFTSSTGDQLIYSLQNTPIWLQINSTTRTLYGTPESSNLGPLIFNLLADDGSGTVSMQATLVVVNSSVPEVRNVTEAITSAGPLSDTTTVSLRTGSPFNISMQDIFSSIDRPIYYTTSLDHSPLPSWVQFDLASLSFSGSTPSALSAPQTYGISLHISTVEGFSEASASFSLAVGSHQLYFTSVQSGITVAENASFELSVLRNALDLDNKTAASQFIRTIAYQGPDWISFDNETRTLSGKPPLGAVSRNITFTAQDIYGDTAVSHLALEIASNPTPAPPLFLGLSTVNATIGGYFSYAIPQSSVAIADFTASLSIPDGYPWLTFVASNLTIHGNVPNRLTPGVLGTNLTISTSTNNSTESSTFDISFLCSSGKTGKDGACDGANVTSSSKHKLSSGAAAAIGVVAAILALLFLLALAYLLYRTLSNDEEKSKPWISRPIGSGDRWRNSDHPYGIGGLESDDERSVVGAQIARHQRSQSDGTYLEPADVDAITAMNRTSLGIGALRDKRKASNPTKEPPKHIWDKRTGSRKNIKIIADALRAKLGSIRMPQAPVIRWASIKSHHRQQEPTPSLRIWAANRTHGSDDDDIQNTLATPSMSSIGNTTDVDMSNLETVTPQTMTAFHYPKPSTVSQRPPPPIPSKSTERGADIRLVSLAPSAAEPPQLPPIHSLTSMTTEDTRPVHEKRQSYIRNRASDRNKGSRNALFAAGGGLDEDVDRGRSGRTLAVPKRSAKMLSRSRSSSLGIGAGSRLPASIAEGSASEFGRTEDWITVRDGDDGDVYEDIVEEERARQDKRMKWRERLNRNSKGQVRGGQGGVSYEEQDETGRENRHARTQSWIRQALSPTRLKRLSQQSPLRQQVEEEAQEEPGLARLVDDRLVSAATQASSTRAFL